MMMNTAQMIKAFGFTVLCTGVIFTINPANAQQQDFNGPQFQGQNGQQGGPMQGKFRGRQGQGGQFGQQGQQGQHGKRMQAMQEMGITQEQMQQLKSLKESSKQQSQVIKQQLQEKRKALMQYMGSPDATESQAMAMSQEINSLAQHMSDLRIKAAFQMRNVLTPEQYQQYVQHRKKRMGKMRQRMGQHGGQQGGQPGGRQGGPGQGQFGNRQFGQGGQGGFGGGPQNGGNKPFQGRKGPRGGGNGGF